MPAPRSDSPATPHGQRTLAALSADQLAASKRPILEYVSSLIRIARWQLLAAVLIMTFTSLTEGLGVALLFPILQVAGFNLANQGHVGHYTGEVRALLVLQRIISVAVASHSASDLHAAHGAAIAL